MDWESGLLLLPGLLLCAAPPTALAMHDLAMAATIVIAHSPPLRWTDFQNALICSESDPLAPVCVTASPPA